MSGDGESQTGSANFGTEEGGKNQIEVFLGNPFAGIGYFYLDLFVPRGAGDG